jgi:hypothetical protein
MQVIGFGQEPLDCALVQQGRHCVAGRVARVEQNWHAGIDLPQPTDDFVGRQAGHRHIQQDQVDAGGGLLRERAELHLTLFDCLGSAMWLTTRNAVCHGRVNISASIAMCTVYPSPSRSRQFRLVSGRLNERRQTTPMSPDAVMTQTPVKRPPRPGRAAGWMP